MRRSLEWLLGKGDGDILFCSVASLAYGSRSPLHVQLALVHDCFMISDLLLHIAAQARFTTHDLANRTR